MATPTEAVLASLARAQNRLITDYNTVVAELYAYYQGDHEALTDALLQTHYRETFSAEGVSAAIIRDYPPFIARLVNELGQCFTRRPALWLVDSAGAPLPSTDARMDHLRAFCAETRLFETLPEIDRLSALLSTVFPTLSYREQSLMFDILLPDEVSVDESASAPGQLPWATAIWIPTWSSTRSTHVRDSETTYQVWTRSRDATGNLLWGTYYVNASGETLAHPLGWGDGHNRYGFHPVVAWHEFVPRNTVYLQPDCTLLQAQRVANVRAVLLHESLNFHSLGLLKITGQEADRAGRINLGPRATWTAAAQDSDLQYVGGTANLMQVWEIYKEWLQLQAVLRGLPGTSLDPKVPSIQTGAGVEARRIDLTTIRDSRAVRARSNLERALNDVWLRQWGFWFPKQDVLAGGARVVARLAGDADGQVDQSTAQADDLRMRAGVTDPVDIILRGRGIDPAEATPEERAAAEARGYDSARRYARWTALSAEARATAESRAGGGVAAE